MERYFSENLYACHGGEGSFPHFRGYREASDLLVEASPCVFLVAGYQPYLLFGVDKGCLCCSSSSLRKDEKRWVLF